jgi:hypothetical protein
MKTIRATALASIVLATSVLQAQWTQTDPNAAIITTDPVVIGTSPTTPTHQFEVFGDSAFSGFVNSKGVVVSRSPTTALGRFDQVTNDWVGMTINARFDAGGWMLDNPNLPAWFAKVDSRPGWGDNFAIYRIAPGAGYHNGDEKGMFFVRGDGTVIIHPRALGYTAMFGETMLTEPYGQGVVLNMASGNSTIRLPNMQFGILQRAVVTSHGAPLELNPMEAQNVVIGASSHTTALIVQSTGTSTFAGSLTVTGNIQGGNIAAKYQDVAEWVNVDSDMSPGTVVVVGRERANTVTAATEPFDTRVAGVVSEQPGVILGEGGAAKEMVATTGRVRVRVDASRNPIAIGDLLVTSGKPGMAMKSIPVEVAGISMHRPGTIVGKALEPLASGEGEILVLLSLQ